jgi:bifunctional DNase/RNase
MRRKQLKLMGLSYSQTQIGSYIAVLSEKKGNRKVPIIVKPGDAQNIAVKLENIKVGRPLTHDVFKAMSDAFDIEISEVFIYALVEGVFYAKFLTTDGSREHEIECTIGDALAISLTYKCPIWISLDVLDTAGIDMNDDGTEPEFYAEDEEEGAEEYQEPGKVASVEDLEHLMQNALANEEYEIAAELRDRIAELKGDQE